MSPLALAGVWVAAGVAGASGMRTRRARRLAGLAPLVAGALGILTTTGSTAGPFASVRFGGDLALGRPELGLLVAVGPAVALTLVLAPHLDGGEVLAVCLAGAASVVALASTHPVIWGLALAVGVGAVTLRWISVAPSRATLSAARVAGLGVAALLGAAVLLPVLATPSDVRAAIAGALLAAGIALVLGLAPVGGWAAGVGATVRGADLASWAFVLVPAVLLAARAAVGWLGGRSADAFAETLLALGLLSAVYGGLHALLARPSERYCRVLLADLGLIAAGLGTRREDGALAVFVLLLAHLTAGPLLLNPARPGIERPRRLAWLAVSGLPPSIAFWGRLLVLGALEATNGTALLAGVAGMAMLAGAAVRGVGDPPDGAGGAPVPVLLRAAAWTAAAGTLVAGLAPAWIAGHVFGVDLGAG
ncbi:MAG TPA: hypothetical protein VFO60_06320 [Candidatus Dormibacteraeota bacterium]|nr:hypothetical protein [Candidatus Dormibacteraeota bacterium]